ncbi:MAG TPA: thiamine diphosphokinase, partial [Anaerovoracaceae bacterium]|nr:thiamine diphosphokinase [Anaerovoracaceae bacterium]
MRGLIMANGEYGGLNWYAKRKDKYPYILCTDGAAKMARRLDILPDAVVGDMDSISQGDLLYMEDREVSFFRHPPEKDFTDTHLALELLREKGFSDITIWGGTGGRLDHTISNILSTITFVQIGISIIFEEPGLTIYIIEDK